MKIKIEGGAELAKALNALSARTSKKVMREALEVAGEPIRRSIGTKAPRAPGAPDIAENIVIGNARSDNSSQNGTTSAIAIGPAKGFFYGYFQEFGTIFHGAKPFVRPGFESGVSGAIAELVRSTWTILAGRGISRSVSAPTSVSDSAFKAGGVGRGKPSRAKVKPVGGKR